MPALSDDLTRTAIFRVRVTMPGDATNDLLDVRPLSPDGGSACRAIRWVGDPEAVESVAAELWVRTATQRAVFTASETSEGIPNEREATPIYFSASWEEKDVQATHLDTDSTAGIWEITF